MDGCVICIAKFLTDICRADCFIGVTNRGFHLCNSIVFHSHSTEVKLRTLTAGKVVAVVLDKVIVPLGIAGRFCRCICFPFSIACLICLGIFCPNKRLIGFTKCLMGKDIRIAVRVTAKEKEKIQSKARKCGLSTTEYVKQRALGYEPRGIPPDALFLCLEKLGELADKTTSPKLDKEIGDVLKEITAAFLLPGKG